MRQSRVRVRTRGQGLYDLSNEVQRVLRELVPASAIGLCHVFCCHTSCSLVLMENADPTARADLEAFFSRMVPEEDPAFTHTLEGPDDMPSHIRMALTRTQETIPFARHHLLTGTWQGLYLWEHRRAPHLRELVITLQYAEESS